MWSSCRSGHGIVEWMFTMYVPLLVSVKIFFGVHVSIDHSILVAFWESELLSESVCMYVSFVVE